MDFKVWKQLPAVQEMATRLGFGDVLAESRDWNDYNIQFTAANYNDGRVVRAARSVFGDLSTGERPVLAAMLHAAGFSKLADELCGAENWSRLDSTYGDHAVAVGLAIMRR
jgi:hypothetical protein